MPDSVPDEEWEAGARALHPLWESLGFTLYEGHIFVLDPNYTHLDEAAEGFRRRLGI
jgi:hypothetical protein